MDMKSIGRRLQTDPAILVERRKPRRSVFLGRRGEGRPATKRNIDAASVSSVVQTMPRHPELCVHP